MIAESRVRGPSPRFDYTEAQWKKILACVPDPIRFDRAALVVAGNRYLENVTGKTRQPKERRKKWAAVARLAAELGSNLKCWDDPRNELIIRNWNSRAERWELARDLEILEFRARQVRRSLVEKYSSDPSEIAIPRIAFYRRAIGIWLQAGGTLAVKQHNGEPCGPNIRYIRAVTTPLIVGKAPKPETIRTLLEQEEDRLRRDYMIGLTLPKEQIRAILERARNTDGSFEAADPYLYIHLLDGPAADLARIEVDDSFDFLGDVVDRAKADVKELISMVKSEITRLYTATGFPEPRTVKLDALTLKKRHAWLQGKP